MSDNNKKKNKFDENNLSQIALKKLQSEKNEQKMAFTNLNALTSTGALGLYFKNK